MTRPMMTWEECSQFINALDQLADDDAVGKATLCAPVHAKMKATGFKNLGQYLFACARLEGELRKSNDEKF